MYCYVLYYNIEKSGFNVVPAYLLFLLSIVPCGGISPTWTSLILYRLSEYLYITVTAHVRFTIKRH